MVASEVTRGALLLSVRATHRQYSYQLTTIHAETLTPSPKNPSSSSSSPTGAFVPKLTFYLMTPGECDIVSLLLQTRRPLTP